MSAPSSNSSPSTGTTASKMKGILTVNNGIIVLSSATFISLFIAAFVQMSNFIGSKDDWNDLKPKVLQIGLLTVFGTIAFGVASIMYMVQNETFAIYFSMIVATLSLGIAFAGLAIASISR